MSDAQEVSAAELLLPEMHRDRWFAHEHLFKHRHPKESSPAHRALVADLHSSEPRRVIEGFRGLGKSTYLEEAAIIRAGFGEFRHMLILGSTEGRACDRLEAIKSEIVNNDLIRYLFKIQFSSDSKTSKTRDYVWQHNQIVIRIGLRRVRILALGRDQQLLGVKWEDVRPDSFLVDDIEEAEEKRTDQERTSSWRWWLQSFLPALLDPLLSWGRISGTRRGSGSLLERLETESGVPVSRYPIEYVDAEGKRAATWPALRPLAYIDQMRATYRGDMQTYMEEYMCQADGGHRRDFSEAMMRVAPRTRSWEATYAFIDPASSVRQTSATTGWAVWSWINRRLVIWDGGAETLLPDAIVTLAYHILDDFDPIWLGVEKDGLNQFLTQPLRQEQVRRGLAIAPIKPVAAISGTAGAGKLAFIRGLIKFFDAGEVEFAKPCPDLQAQLLSFPYGKIDAPNALAYAQTLQPGAPVYDGFGMEHVAETLDHEPRQDLWVAANATKSLVTAVVLQSSMGRTRVLRDYAMEGEPAVLVPLLVRDVGLAYRATPKVCCGPSHFDRWMNVGLAQAFRAMPLEVEAGTVPDRGRELLRTDLMKMPHGQPVVQVSRAAKWTLNALAGGYARQLGKGGILDKEPETGVYRTLMEGLESCIGRMSVAAADDSDANWAYTASGHRYRKYARA